MMLARFVAAFGLTVLLPVMANAQSWQDQWTATLEKAKSQTLTAMVAGEEAYQLIMNEFSKKYGIKVETTVSRPSSALARIQTEQKNNQFIWDVWMGGTSNMVNSAAPAGLLQPMEPFFILPEVKDTSNWRHADFLFGDSKRQVFTNSNKLEFYVLRNNSNVPDVKVQTWDDLLNPKLKGKIVVRDMSVPNAGTFAMATAYGVKGPDFVRKLLKDQDVKVFENPQQLDSAINRGGAAVSIGLETYLWDKCRADGGCKEIDNLYQFGAAISLGLTVPKNAPDKEASAVFLNWYLSKEGQEFWVNAWAKQNTSGAVSMRKDVAPFKGHENSMPDFSNPKNYVFVSSERGSEEVAATIKLFKEATGH
jgi:ABC-type Fe3+ transport system substrate-binding protein